MTVLSDLAYPDTVAINACLHNMEVNQFRIIALDGRDGAGKTTLGHYLALHSHRQFLDTDLYLKRRKLAPPTHTKDLMLVLSRWKRLNRPIILAGIFLGDTLAKNGLSADTLVRVIRASNSGNDSWASQYNDYEGRFAPDIKVFLPCHGAECPDRKCHMLRKDGVSENNIVGACVWCKAQSRTDLRRDRPWWE